jgi:hypothetical protein
MIVLQVLKHKPAMFRCFTGMNLVAYQTLLPVFERAYDADLDRRDQARTTKRQRAHGGGRNSTLKGIADKLLFILFYFKVYSLQEVQGYLNLGQGQTLPLHDSAV